MTTTKGPLVCICVPTYNSGTTLRETLDSILGQSYGNLRVFIVDNTSADDTLAIADGYAGRDPRLKVFRHSENIGAEGNFTRCLGLACGEYTAIYHSDDVYGPAMVGEQVAFLESRPQAGAVFAMAQSLDGGGRPGRIYRLPPELRRDPPALYGFDEIFRALLKYGNFFFCPGVMARTPVYRDHIRVWDASGFGSSADLDVWLRILARYPVGIIDKPLFYYRGDASSSFSYAAARKRTGPHDMLRVFAAYAGGRAAALMGRTEAADYSLLVLKDDINRAFNLFAAGDRAAARALLGGLFRPGNILHALKSGGHLKITAYGCAVYLLTLLPLWEKARYWICRFRFQGGFPPRGGSLP